MREIDTNLFREIIEDRGCFCVFEEIIDGIGISHYFPNNSARRVLIITSDEFISEKTAKGHLMDLELWDLLDNLPFQDCN
jgi:hypothetical protein